MDTYVRCTAYTFPTSLAVASHLFRSTQRTQRHPPWLSLPLCMPGKVCQHHGDSPLHHACLLRCWSHRIYVSCAWVGAWVLRCEAAAWAPDTIASYAVLGLSCKVMAGLSNGCRCCRSTACWCNYEDPECWVLRLCTSKAMRADCQLGAKLDVAAQTRHAVQVLCSKGTLSDCLLVLQLTYLIPS